MMSSIANVIREHSRGCGVATRAPRPGDRVGFLFSTKDRPEFTEPTLRSIDEQGGFDLIWADGSDTQEGRTLPDRFPLRRARLAEMHRDVRGGPDAAIAFGLSRLVELGYDYCGLIENDVVLGPGWFAALLGAIEAASADGLAVGAATVRSYESRVLEFRDGYTINWAVGAGMVLFTREAAELVLERYRRDGLGPWTTARRVARFYRDLCGVDLRGIWDLWTGRLDRCLSSDWAYATILHEHGLASVGTIPSLATDLEDAGKPEALGTVYVDEALRGRGLWVPLVRHHSRAWLDATDPLYTSAWAVFRRSPALLAAAQWLRDRARAPRHPARPEARP
jgi:hypothetical protein